MILNKVLIIQEQNKENIILDNNLAKKFENLPVVYGEGDLVVGYLYNPEYVASEGIFSDVWILDAFYKKSLVNFQNNYITFYKKNSNELVPNSIELEG